jgi:hypothetical protein
VAFTAERFNVDAYRLGRLREGRTVATWGLGTISAFASRQEIQ